MNVEIALRRPESNCADNIGSAFAQMQQLSLSVDGRNQLNSYFKFDSLKSIFVSIQPPFGTNTTPLLIDNCKTKTSLEFLVFANLYGYYQGVTQYTYDGRVSWL